MTDPLTGLCHYKYVMLLDVLIAPSLSNSMQRYNHRFYPPIGHVHTIYLYMYIGWLARFY